MPRREEVKMGGASRSGRWWQGTEGAKFSTVMFYLGRRRWGLRRPYSDSLHWAKFEDKELLISNKAEYLSV